MNLGTRIRKLRQTAKLSGETFGAICGVSKAAVSLWESNLAVPSIANVMTLHNKLGFDLNWLLAGEGVAPDENPIDRGELQRVAQEAALYAVKQYQKRKKVSNGDDG